MSLCVFPLYDLLLTPDISVCMLSLRVWLHCSVIWFDFGESGRGPLAFLGCHVSQQRHWRRWEGIKRNFLLRPPLYQQAHLLRTDAISWVGIPRSRTFWWIRVSGNINIGKLWCKAQPTRSHYVTHISFLIFTKHLDSQSTFTVRNDRQKETTAKTRNHFYCKGIPSKQIIFYVL